MNLPLVCTRGLLISPCIMSNILFEWEKRQFPERTLESDEMLALIAFPV